MQRKKSSEGKKLKRKKPEKSPPKYQFNYELQGKIVGNILAEPWFLKNYRQYLRPEYFENVIHQKIVGLTIEYFDKYDCLPEIAELDNMLKTELVDKQRLSKKEIDEVIWDLSIGDNPPQYIIDLIIEFARYQAIKQAHIKAAKLVGKGKHEEAKRVIDQAHKVGIDDDQKAEDLDSFLSREIPKRDIFVESWVQRNALSMLAGREKIGKSIIVTNMMLSLAKGEKFLNFNVPKPKCILYFQQEVSEDDFQSRLKLMLVEEEINNILGKNFYHLTTRGRELKITNSDDRQKIHNEIERVYPDLVVFDPFSSFHNKNENQADQMAQVLEYFFEIIYKFRVGVLIIHHYGKPSEAERTGAHKFRGSSVFGDKPDILICMDKLPKKYKEKMVTDYDRHVEISWELRSSIKPADMIVVMNEEDLHFYEADLEGYFGEKLTPEGLRDIIISWGGKMSQAELIDHCKKTGIASYATIHKNIRKAEEKEYIYRDRKGGRGGPLWIFIKKRG